MNIIIPHYNFNSLNLFKIMIQNDKRLIISNPNSYKYIYSPLYNREIIFILNIEMIAFTIYEHEYNILVDFIDKITFKEVFIINIDNIYLQNLIKYIKTKKLYLSEINNFNKIYKNLSYNYNFYDIDVFTIPEQVYISSLKIDINDNNEFKDISIRNKNLPTIKYEYYLSDIYFFYKKMKYFF